MIELKKYAHVNKKALDQFLQFSDERDKLTNRKSEIDEAHRVGFPRHAELGQILSVDLF